MLPTVAKKIIDALANGINPETGEILPAESIFHSHLVCSALLAASNSLSSHKKNDTSSTGPNNHGKPWSEVEDTELLIAFDAGVLVKDLAAKHSRSIGGITSRLVRLGRLTESSHMGTSESTSKPMSDEGLVNEPSHAVNVHAASDMNIQRGKTEQELSSIRKHFLELERLARENKQSSTNESEKPLPNLAPKEVVDVVKSIPTQLAPLMESVERTIPEKNDKPNREQAKQEFENIFTASWTGDNPIRFERDLVRAGGMVTLDFYFSDVRMAVIVHDGDEQTAEHIYHDVEGDLGLESMGITLVCFSIDEIFGNRHILIGKLKSKWQSASNITKGKGQSGKQNNSSRRPASVKNKKHQSINSGTGSFKGGWTSLSQGVKRMGEATYAKQYVNEGIAGTRDENKKMRGQLWGDMRNRSKGR